VAVLAAAQAVAIVVLLWMMPAWPPLPAAPTGAQTVPATLPAALEHTTGQDGIAGAAQADGDTARFVTPPSAAGWLAVTSDLPISVVANGTLLGSTRSGRFQLQAGDHELVLTNEATGYRLAQTVRIQAGQTMHIAATLARDVSSGAPNQ
jgi:hypothetical protein